MEKKDIAAFLTGCQADEMMAYRDVGELGCVVVGPDGRKFKYTIEDLEHGLAKAMVKELKEREAMKAAAKAARIEPAPRAKPKPKPRATKRKAPAKKRTNTK
jgi:hypothetical protein